MSESKKSVFETLNAIDVSKHIKQKNNQSYLSWAWAWGIVKEHFPDTTYRVYENEHGLNYHNDGKTAWVKVGVTISGEECIEYLPIMNYSNKSIPINTLTSMDVNKAIQRALTKAIARHGLGLYIYAGEDLPSATDGNDQPQQQENPNKIFVRMCKDAKVDPKVVSQKMGVSSAKPETVISAINNIELFNQVVNEVRNGN